LEVLEPRRAPTRVDLTVSYRTPEEVLDFAAPTLRAAAPDLTPPRPVRRAGHVPSVHQVSREEFVATLAEVTRREVDAVAPGRIAVIVSGERVEEIVSILRSKGLDAIDPRDPESKGLGADLIVLSAEGANGLEFDGVVVVEPVQIASRGARGLTSSTARGLRTLYVAMTRPTRRLAIVAVEPLPETLR
jgi:DNA helicase IV